MPWIEPMSIPRSAAIRWATGETARLGASVDAVARRCRHAVATSGWPSVAGAPDGAAPAVISASGWPTLTTSSGSTRSFVMVPAAGAGTSASTLSVETSTTVSPSATESPTATAHSSTVPSVTDSPISGIATVTDVPPASSASAGSVAA